MHRISTTEPIVIYGCGGHSRSIADIILTNTPAARIIFVDDCARVNEKIFGFDVKSSISSKVHYSCIIGIGDNEKRKSLFSVVNDIEAQKIISVISHKAYFGFDARIETGCFVGNFCHIGPEVHVGHNTILNNACVIDHEVKIGAHCHIGPNATVSGRSKIGDLVFVGVGATIIDRVSICSNVVIGAGATVVDDICEPGIYIGTPARKMIR